MPYNKQYVKWQEITKDLDSLIGRNLTKVAEEMDPEVLGGDPRELEPTGEDVLDDLEDNDIVVGEEPLPSESAADVKSDEYLLDKMGHSILSKIRRALTKRSSDTVEVSTDKLEDIAGEISDIVEASDTVEDLVSDVEEEVEEPEEPEEPEEVVELSDEEIGTLKKEGYSNKQIKMYRALKQRGADVANYIRKQASLRLIGAMKNSAVPQELEKYGSFCARTGYGHAINEIKANRSTIGSYYAGQAVAELEKSGYVLSSRKDLTKRASYLAGRMVANLEPTLTKRASYLAGRMVANLEPTLTKRASKNVPNRNQILEIASEIAMQKIAALQKSGRIIVRDFEAERNANIIKQAAKEATERTLQELYKRSTQGNPL
jgi:hypothetical protein